MQHITSLSIMDEFINAEVGDQRLTARLCQLAQALAEQPDVSIPKATGSWGQTCAAYRFFDNDALRFDDILAPHFERTRQRAATESVVLAVNDSTSLNYDQRPATSGLGPIRTRADKTFGLWLHSLIAFSTEGTPLGLLQAQCWARDPSCFGSRHQRHSKPTEQKESGKWLCSFAALQSMAAQTPTTRWVFVADREADIYDLFVSAQSSPQGPALLIRAHHDRRLPRTEKSLFAHLAQAPLAGQVRVLVPRRVGQRARTAMLTVRITEVNLQPPDPKGSRPALQLWAMEAREEHPPCGIAPIHWRLVTSLPLRQLADAVEKLHWYCRRWGIEVFHKVLKSGCAVEAVQLQTAARLQRYLAIKLVVAWRVMALTQLGRERPDTLLSEIFEETEWRILQAVGERVYKGPRRRGVPIVGDGVRWLGQLGGHLGRRGDGAPGPLCLARGLERFHDITIGWKMAQGTGKCA
jgi:hypothetical protein